VTAAELVAEARRLRAELDGEFAAALVGVAARRDVKDARKRLDHFLVNHGEQLVSIVAAAVEWEAADTEYIKAEPAVPMTRLMAAERMLASLIRGESFDALAGGEEKT